MHWSIKHIRRLLPAPVHALLRRILGVAGFIRQWLRYQWRLRTATPVLVHHMGKVGSTSTHRSIAAVWHGVALKAHRFADHDDWRVRDLYRRSVLGDAPLKVVSLVREPVGRNVSTFFQIFDRATGVPFDEADFTLAELREMFLNNIDHREPLEWFDRHIRDTFGIDVYASPFPDRGYETYRRDSIELLVMRLDIPDDQKREALREFLQVPHLEMIAENVGKEKVYARTYARFKDTIDLPGSYLDDMCQSRYFRHFYDTATIERVRSRWSPEPAGRNG